MTSIKRPPSRLKDAEDEHAAALRELQDAVDATAHGGPVERVRRAAEREREAWIRLEAAREGGGGTGKGTGTGTEPKPARKRNRKADDGPKR